jgi:myo-inositol-1(or 4)-monophosphatase
MKTGYYTTVAVEAALKAGEILKKYYRKNFQYYYKDTKNPVTQIDLLSQEEIKKIIQKNFKNHNILAEEDYKSQSIDFSNYWWIIDPLDGTINYRKGFPIFCVSIALAKDGEIIMGVIYSPITDELFIAEKNSGAYMNDKKINVSNSSDLLESVLATGFGYALAENPDPHIEIFKKLSLKTEAVRRAGSAAMDLAYTASGIFDGFWESSLNPWDTAAGVILVQEAGGYVTDYFGNPYTLSSKTIVASNKAIHPQIIEITKNFKEG